MIEKYGKVIITRAGITINGFTFNQGNPEKEALEWAKSRIEEELQKLLMQINGKNK